MKAKLHVVWDGDAPGLAEHQLSIAALGRPLQLLLDATRRIASNLLMGTDEQSERGAKGGRLASEAQAIDLRVTTLNPGCLDMELDVVFAPLPDGQLSLQETGLPERTMAELLAALSDESKGQSRNVAVRKFLGSLTEVSTQRYTASYGGEQLGSVEIGTVELPDEPVPQLYLAEVRGVISGVLFAPHRPEIRICRHDGTTCRFAASAEQVDIALSLRGVSSVVARAMTDRNGQYSLLSLRDAVADLAPRVPPETARRHVLARWRESLDRLSM